MPNATLESLDLNIRYGEELSSYTTFKLGGPCKGLVTCRTPNHVEKIVRYFNREGYEYILIGGGSNIVVSDKGVDCFIIRYFSDIPLIEQDGDELVVSGSTGLDALALFAAQNGLEGLNCTTGIPGTVGGAVVGNGKIRAVRVR